MTWITVSSEDDDLFYEIPICFCGRPARLLETYHRVLRVVPPQSTESVADLMEHVRRLAMGVPSDPDPYIVARDELCGEIGTLAYDLVLGVLDNMDCIDHGGTIDYPWRTDKGERLLGVLDLLEPSGYDDSICGSVLDEMFDGNVTDDG